MAAIAAALRIILFGGSKQSNVANPVVPAVGTGYTFYILGF